MIVKETSCSLIRVVLSDVVTMRAPNVAPKFDSKEKMNSHQQEVGDSRVQLVCDKNFHFLRSYCIARTGSQGY